MQIPADDIVGLYHPFRDLYAKDYPNGVSYKNFLITDPVRQQYPWKSLVMDLEKKFEFPLWNPYEFSGTPLLANFQSASFYFFNRLFLVFPFNLSWSLLIVSQNLLTLIFMYFFLLNFKLNKQAALLGSLTFAFSGFSIAWLEWGNILSTALWLSLILLSIDKIFYYLNSSDYIKLKVKIKKNILWSFIFVVSLINSFFAGHLQIFFYVFMLSFAYFWVRWFQNSRQNKSLIYFSVCFLLFAIFTSIQWIPTLHFIGESARSIDQMNWQKDGWFIPWQNIIQFLVPDFFGNPATLNYWGVWNYAEFVGYIGILPLVMAMFALFFKKDKTIFFFGTVFFVSLVLSYPTFVAKIPYILNIPLISTAQPTRLIFLTDFSLAVLSAFGLNHLNKNKKGIFYVIGFTAVIFVLLWGIVVNSSDPNLLISKQNLIFPSAVFLVVSFLLFLRLKKNKLSNIIIYILVALTIVDLFRFGWKFTPFTNRDYLFPKTKILDYLQSQKGQFRIISTDSRILPPNFSVIYKIQSVEGYDPLYLERFGELIAASERQEPNINPPFGFDRIITPHNYESKIVDLLGAKYVLSLSDLQSTKLTKIFQEGQTQLYENKNAMPRAFFVESTIFAKDRNDAIKKMFDNKDSLNKIGIVEGTGDGNWALGRVDIKTYKENKVIIETENKGEGFLILTDSFYSSWHVKVDGKETKILRSDFNFRGVMVPKGSHTVEFYITLL